MRYLLTLIILIAVTVTVDSALARDWRNADRSSAGIAPKADEEPRAVVQVYAARTFGWHRYLAVHSWIATKEKHAQVWQTYHVIGFRARRGLPVVVVEDGIPDARWFGSEPEILRDLRGPSAEKAILKIKEAAANYPYQNSYRMYPGPNSNTFIAHILRSTPEIGVELPTNAIGRDWIGQADPVGPSQTRTGFSVSLFGLLGFSMGLGDGIEVNLLGLGVGVDLLRPAIKLPFVGRIGFSDKAVFADEPETL